MSNVKRNLLNNDKRGIMRKDTNEGDKMNYKFDVALSFSYDMEKEVQKVADFLEAAGLQVFFYESRQNELFSHDLDKKTYQIYHEQSLVKVLFVTELYGKRKYTQLEKRLSVDSTKFQKERLIIVNYLGKDIEAEFGTVIYIEGNKKTLDEIAMIVQQRVMDIKEEHKKRKACQHDKNNKKGIVVEIPQGATTSTISDILYKNKLIKNKTMFKISVKLSNKAQHFKAGKYLFNQTYSNKEIIEDISSGKIYNDGIKITIPEGSTSKEIVSILVGQKLGNEESYEKLISNPKEFYNQFKFLKEEDITSLEGFLYPSTYYFDENASEKEVLSVMLSQFNKVYTDKLRDRQKELKMTIEQVVNLASIVEKEAVLDEDRPIIASVFYNRLKIGMPLQSDATIQYIFKERKKIVTYKDLEIDSPYNSYKNKGLPPTPIASPGIKSIEATLYPEKTEYLYFVAKMDGGNNYSTNYEDHLKYVKEYKDERDRLNKEK